MTEELTARQELEEIALLLQEADSEEKAHKREKELLRGPFFDLISEIVREEIPLARKTETVQVDEDFDPERWRAFNYPDWRIVAMQPESDGEGAATRMQITVEENEELKKYEFVANGFKFGRTIRMEGRDFKAESFYKEIQAARLNERMGKHDHPLLALGDDVLNHLEVVVTKELVPTFKVDEDKAIEIMAEYPETVALFQKYTFPGTPKPALLPIKKAKNEDE